MTSEQPVVIGILGGVASGKSAIANEFKRHGAVVLSADDAAHEVLRFVEIKALARERWGDSIFGPDGEIDRPALAKIVFAPPPVGEQEREFLEELTHPRIGQLLAERLEAIRGQKNVPAIVLDVPLLYETGWNKFCNVVVYVAAEESVRQARARCRGWSAEEVARREATQATLDVKRAAADFVIDNSGSLEVSRAQIDQFWTDVIACHHS
ncbi:MAG TPA: dephospho-CoA kinase [Pirellulales bacterium]|jgi:dephospho-CoA kinase|nr:dephospho-CoA kinase [Pirellulales bacterium]